MKNIFDIFGLLILLGLFTRLKRISLLVAMIVAIATAKSEVLAKKGFWEIMHGSRTDWTMFLGSIFLFIRVGGTWSADKILTKNGA